MNEETTSELRAYIADECAKLKRLVRDLGETVEKIKDVLPDFDSLYEESAAMFKRLEVEPARIEAIRRVFAVDGKLCRDKIEYAIELAESVAGQLDEQYFSFLNRHPSESRSNARG